MSRTIHEILFGFSASYACIITLTISMGFDTAAPINPELPAANSFRKNPVFAGSVAPNNFLNGSYNPILRVGSRTYLNQKIVIL